MHFSVMLKYGLRPLLLSTILWTSLAAASAQTVEIEDCRRLLSHGGASQSERCLAALVAKEPRSVDALRLLGYVLYQEREPLKSLAEYTAAAQLARPSADDLFAVAADYILLKDFADAAKWLSVVTDWQPANALAWYYLGRSYFLLERYDDALSSLHVALKLLPQNVRVQTAIGLAEDAKGDSGTALLALRLAIRWDLDATRHDAQPYLSAGEVERKLGETDAALDYLKQAKAIAPANPSVREELGRALLSLGLLEQAQAEFQSAVELSPDSAALHFQLGRTLKLRGLQADATKEFAEAGRLYDTGTNTEPRNDDALPLSSSTSLLPGSQGERLR